MNEIEKAIQYCQTKREARTLVDAYNEQQARIKAYEKVLRDIVEYTINTDNYAPGAYAYGKAKQALAELNK